MKREDKILYLKENHLNEWQVRRAFKEIEISNSQIMRCCCGRLATGLHEMNCSRFQKKVDSETLKQLTHLIK